ncbi:MAG: gamma-glutamyl-phosphate reductase, partial [Clostridia bacterium]|nr:gamma-glutamyl-phosphate reductase [Clostridia bacterium]
MNNELILKGKLAKDASYKLANLSTIVKNEALEAIADALICNTDKILEANKLDVCAAKERGMSASMVDRLALDGKRIADMAEGVRQIVSLNDPIGETIKMWKRPNGLSIGQRRVPLGVIAIIYEARPNVTVDAAVLCLKTSNAVILRGGSEAIHSNKMLAAIMQE